MRSVLFLEICQGPSVGQPIELLVLLVSLLKAFGYAFARWKCLHLSQSSSQLSTRSRLVECRRSYCYVSTDRNWASFDKSAAYLRIIKLIRLIFRRLRGGASFFSLPRYVAFRSLHAMRTETPLASASSIATRKSYSYEMVDCSRPVPGAGGRSSSLRMKVYCFASASVMNNSIPS